MRVLTNLLPQNVKRLIKSSFPYKVYGRRTTLSKFPESINLELTNKCTLKCWMCPHSKMTWMQKGEIRDEIFEKAIKDLKEISGFKSITPVGLGEPLCCSKIEWALARLNKEFPKTPLDLVSNATLLDENAAKMLCKRLKDKDQILFSINVWDQDMYRELMGADLFKTVVSNIERLARLRDSSGSKFAIKVQIIESKKTVSQIKAFKKFWSKKLTGPKDGIYVRRLENWGGKIDTKALQLKETKKRYPCSSLWSIVMIDINGNAYPCCEALSTREKSPLCLGNIQKSSVKELYTSEKYKNLREIHLKAKWDSIPECKYCDFWASSPNVWLKFKGKFY